MASTPIGGEDLRRPWKELAIDSRDEDIRGEGRRGKMSIRTGDSFLPGAPKLVRCRPTQLPNF